MINQESKEIFPTRQKTLPLIHISEDVWMKQEQILKLAKTSAVASHGYSQGARGTYRPLPPPPPQEPPTMVPKCTLGCPEHNLTCSPESHWDALEL